MTQEEAMLLHKLYLVEDIYHVVFGKILSIGLQSTSRFGMNNVTVYFKRSWFFVSHERSSEMRSYGYDFLCLSDFRTSLELSIQIFVEIEGVKIFKNDYF